MIVNNKIVPGFDDEANDSIKIRLLKIKEVNNCLCLYLNGYIDTYNSCNFKSRVNKAIKTGYIKLIFHFGGLNYISSTGLETLVSFVTSTKPGGEILIVEMKSRVHEVFQLMGFLDFFNVRNNLEEAIKYFLAIDSKHINRQIFPKSFKCPKCSKKLRVTKPIRARCGKCKAILVIDNSGQVLLG